MGCFDGVCAFTRTAIGEGDEVLIVALNTDTYMKDSLLGTYNLLNYCYNYRRWRDEYKTPFRYIGVGLYDSYGSIEGYDNEVGSKTLGSWADYQFLVHKSVAEGLLDRPLNETDLEGDAFKLVELAFLARIQLKGNFLLGGQHFEEDEILLQRKVLALTSEVLDRHQTYIDELKDDDEEL